MPLPTCQPCNAPAWEEKLDSSQTRAVQNLMAAHPVPQPLLLPVVLLLWLLLWQAQLAQRSYPRLTWL